MLFGVQSMGRNFTSATKYSSWETFTQFYENLCLFCVYSYAINRLEQSNLYAFFLWSLELNKILVWHQTVKHFHSQWLLQEHFIRVKQTSSQIISWETMCFQVVLLLWHFQSWNIQPSGQAFIWITFSKKMLPCTNRYIHPMISWNLKNFQHIWYCLLMISLFTKLVTYLAPYVKLLLRKLSMIIFPSGTYGDAVLLLEIKKVHVHPVWCV